MGVVPYSVLILMRRKSLAHAFGFTTCHLSCLLLTNPLRPFSSSLFVNILCVIHPPTHKPSCLSSQPISCFFLSLKNKNKRKIHWKAWSLIWAGQRRRAAWSMSATPGITPLRRTDVFLSRLLLFVNSFLARAGSRCPLLLCAGILPPSSLCGLKHAFVVSVSSYMYLRCHVCFFKITLHLCFYPLICIDAVYMGEIWF